MSDRDHIRFRVDGVPAPQGSKTVARAGSGRSFVREDNAALEPWRNAVSAAAHKAMDGRQPFAGALFLEATFYFPRPKAHYRTGRHAGELKASAPGWCTTRPDLDKLVRAVGDAITGIVCQDDTQIAEIGVAKVYGPPGLDVAIEELPAITWNRNLTKEADR